MTKVLPVGVIALDSSGNVELWDSVAEQMLGWTKEEVVGRPVPISLPRDGQTESRGQRKNGEWIELEARTIPWADAAGAAHGTLTLIRDRSAARESGRFRELLEAAPDAIIEVDQDGRIVLLNQVTVQLFGYRREQLLNQPVEILIPAEVRAGHHAHRARYWGKPATRPMGTGLTLEGQRKDGSKFPVEISLSPVKFEDSF